jgi:hypothetical protein
MVRPDWSLVPSRLLQEFVNKHGADHQVIYSVSGWLKNNPENYCVKLTSGPKLEGNVVKEQSPTHSVYD